MEVDTLVVSDLVRDRPITEGMTPSTPKMASHHLFTIKTEDQGLSGIKMAEQLHPGAKMAEQCLLGLKIEDEFYTGGCQPGSKTADSIVSGATNFQFRVKMEDRGISGAKMSDQLLSGAKIEEQLFFGAKMEDQFTSGAKMADQCLRAVLWQDMSVNLASTLLHQLSGNAHTFSH